ncbi:uncharacterized protein LOC128071178 [Budorcas taxicolor]|uniref:uncharacterized protein LOC128071178 n=1 Tax=Budorcas taxicolor TaxID=37181 RepID=UPI002283BD00|nr:uncharacterized protein LOC128071178 [Budorcas taxicolor]
MEIISRPQEKENPSLINSPNNYGSSTTSNNNSNSNSNGGSSSSSFHHHHQVPTPPLTPKTISRSETNPYPTTFVQADTSTFKQVVQMLTGSSETAKQASKTTSSDPPTPPSSSNRGCIPLIKTSPKKQSFKLYERRNSLKNGLMISPLVPGFAHNSGFSSPKPEILSPSILDFPSLVLSPVTTLTEDPFNKSSPSMWSSSSEEEKAIAEKKFYLHPSPRTTTPRDSEPQLLPLFPLTSPKISGSSS